MSERIHLATGLLRRRRDVLLVASRYDGHAGALWTLPGGRQTEGELLSETVEREVLEETGLRVVAGELAYVSESYDGGRHFLNATFLLSLRDGGLREARVPLSGDHVEAAAWIPQDEVGSRIAVAVVRDPLVAFLRGELTHRYAGFHQAGVTIRWPNESQ